MVIISFRESIPVTFGVACFVFYIDFKINIDNINLLIYTTR